VRAALTLAAALLVGACGDAPRKPPRRPARKQAATTRFLPPVIATPPPPAIRSAPTPKKATTRATAGPPRIQLGARRLRIVARGLRPNTGYHIEPQSPRVVLGWLKTDEQGAAEVRLAYPLPPGHYRIVGPEGVRVVRAPGDRAAWRRSMAAAYRAHLQSLSLSFRELNREWDKAMNRQSYVIGPTRDFYELNWRRFRTRWDVGLDSVQRQLIDARRRYHDLAWPALHRGLLDACREIGAISRLRSRQLYQRHRRAPHPKDSRQLGDPLIDVDRLHRRIRQVLGQTARLLQAP